MNSGRVRAVLDRLIKWRAYIFGAVVLTGGAAFAWVNRDQFGALRQFDWRFVPGLVTAALGLLILNGLTARQSIAALGVVQSPAEWFGLAVVNAMGNYLGPARLGAVARAVYLNRIRGLPYRAYLSSLLTTYALATAAACWCGVASLWLLRRVGMSAPSWLWVGLPVVAAGIPVGGVLLVAVRPLPMPAFVRPFLEYWAALWSRPWVIAQVFVLQLSFVLVSAWGLWLAYRSVAISIPFWVAVLLSILPIVTQFYSILPGNLGITEFSIGLGAFVLGEEVAKSVLAALIVRCITIFVVCSLGILFSMWFAGALAQSSQDGKTTSAEP